MFVNSLHYVIKSYILQREKELKSSREKWKKKALERQALIASLKKELRETKKELQKIDFLGSK